jgi:hypothetical protein
MYPADIEVVVLDAVSVVITLTTFLKFISRTTYAYIHTYQTDRLLVNDCLVVCGCDQAHRNLSIVVLLPAAFSKMSSGLHGMMASA